jgi:hypothetical protein
MDAQARAVDGPSARGAFRASRQVHETATVPGGAPILEMSPIKPAHAAQPSASLAATLPSAIRADEDERSTVGVERSRDGALSVARNRTAFASGVVFGAKERLLHVSPRTAEEVRRFGLVCQAAWAQQQECEDDENSRFVLYMTHPATSALVMDGGQPAQPFIWQSVVPVLIDVIARGSASECFALVFQLREIAHGLGWDRLSGIVRGLIARLASVDLNAPSPSGRGWWQVAEYGCEVLGTLSNAADSTEESRGVIFDALQAWGDRGVAKALVVARTVRNQPAS